MADKFSISEVYRMAEAIERNGVKFYSEAAQVSKDKNVKKIMLDLAEKEKVHENIFAGWRAEHCGNEELALQDPDGVAEAYIQSMADNHVFNLQKDVSALVASVQTPVSMLRLAIGFEKDTLAFFAALKSSVEEEHREQVDKLMQEEVSHIKELQEGIKALGAE